MNRDESIDWRAPHHAGRDPSLHASPEMGIEVQRYPPYTDAGVYFETITEERSVGSDTVTESDGWMQMLMPIDWNYDEEVEMDVD